MFFLLIVSRHENLMPQIHHVFVYAVCGYMCIYIQTQTYMYLCPILYIRKENCPHPQESVSALLGAVFPLLGIYGPGSIAFLIITNIIITPPHLERVLSTLHY